jgi:ABC-type transport system substrate-binding protein
MKRLGRYQLEERLASGGFGEVWRATLEGELGFRKPVALKVFKNAAVTPSLVNEAQIGARLHHPHVINVYEFGSADGQWFLAMELLDGVTVEDLVRAHPSGLDAESAISVVRQVSEGLAYAHELRDAAGAPMSVVHRDLKPANLIRTSAGVVKILDFGIALFASARRETEPGTVRGTPHYLSPEQANGSEPTSAVDLWALGAIAYELATGAALVPNGPPLKVLARICSLDPVAAAAEVAALVPALGPVVERCLQPDPERRPTAREVATSLGAVVSSGWTGSSRGLEAPRSTPTVLPSRSRRGWAVGGAALLGLAGVALAAGWWWSRPVGGTLAIGVPRERGTLDAFVRTRNLASFVLPLVLEKLTAVDGDGTPLPLGLAAFTPSDDDRVWTLVARTDRWFHPGTCTGPDGARSTADDLVYSLRAAQQAQVLEAAAVAHEPGSDEVSLRFADPTPFLPHQLAEVPLLPHQLEGCEPPGDLAWPVGTGPWRFDAPPGERLELVPHARWVPPPGAAHPVHERLVFRTVVDDEESFHLLASGALQAAELADAGEVPEGLQVGRTALGRSVALKGLLVFRNGPRPLTEAAARRALSEAIPRDLVAGVHVRNPVDPDARFFAPRWLGYEPAIRVEPGDPLALRDHGGLVLGAFEGDRAWADAIGEALGRRGVEVEVVTLSFPTLEEATRPGGRSSVDLALLEMHGESWGTADPWPFLEQLVSNLEVVSFMDGGVREAMGAASVRDRTVRRARYRDVEAALLREVQFVPLGWVTAQGTAVRFAYRPELRGFADGDAILGEDAFAALAGSSY